MADKITFLKKLNTSVQIGDELFYTNISTGTPVPTDPISLGGITDIGHNYIGVASGNLPNIGPTANLLENGFFDADPTNEWTLGNNVSWVNEAIDFGTPLYSLDIANGTCEDLSGNTLQNTNPTNPDYHASISGPTGSVITVNGTQLPVAGECGSTGDCSEGTLGISYSTCLLTGCNITQAELTAWINSPGTFLPDAWCGKCEDAGNVFIQYSTKVICEGLNSTNIWTQNTWTPYIWSFSSNPATSTENLHQDLTNLNLQTNADYVVSFDISNYVSGSIAGYLKNGTYYGSFPDSGVIDANGSYSYTVDISYPQVSTAGLTIYPLGSFEGTIDNIKLIDPADPSAFSDLFFMFRKPVEENISSLKGYFAEVEFSNSDNSEQELFAVGSEATISSK